MVTGRDEPRVSVLLPARDASATLAACLRSLARQSETRWECILVDDASRDDTRAIARTFARGDPRFRIVAGPGRGIAPALQAGLEPCRAPWVARRDADDWLHRELLDRLGYRDCGFPEDYDLLLRILAAGHELGVVPRRLLGWRDEPNRLSRRHPAYSDAAFTACKAEHLATGLLADTAEYVLWGYGGTGRSLRRALAVHDRAPSHIVELHPGRLGQRIHGAPVVGPDALPTLRGRKLIASVAGAGPRGQIRHALARAGFDELRDFVCAA